MLLSKPPHCPICNAKLNRLQGDGSLAKAFNWAWVEAFLWISLGLGFFVIYVIAQFDWWIIAIICVSVILALIELRRTTGRFRCEGCQRIFNWDETST